MEIQTIKGIHSLKRTGSKRLTVVKELTGIHTYDHLGPVQDLDMTLSYLYVLSLYE